jgi:hypothetical protein
MKSLQNKFSHQSSINCLIDDSFFYAYSLTYFGADFWWKFEFDGFKIGALR